MDVAELIETPPLMHFTKSGEPISYGVSTDVLRYLDGHVRPGMRTLETGTGLSTMVFAARGAEHHCVVPEPRLIERVETECAARDVSLERVQFHVAASEAMLPKLDLRDLDLVLIDGRHAFPSPFIDWYYTEPMLRVGGHVIVDDTQLWTGKVLRDFLCSEEEWRIAVDFAPRSCVFEKLAEGSHLKNWTAQPFVADASRRMAKWQRVHKWRRKLGGWFGGR